MILKMVAELNYCLGVCHLKKSSPHSQFNAALDSSSNTRRYKISANKIDTASHSRMDAPNRDASITDFRAPLAPTNKCVSD